MTQYIFDTTGEKPYIEYIKPAIAASAMVNKDITGLLWKEGTNSVYIDFNGDLDASDQSILSGIVTDSFSKTESDVIISTEIKDYRKDDPIEVDAKTGFRAPRSTMLLLRIARDMYNEPTNPLYDATVTPLVSK